MKKVLSIILAVTLIFSCIAIPASALEANENTVTTACAHCFEKIGSFFKNIGDSFSNLFKCLIRNILNLFGSETPPCPDETTDVESTDSESTTEAETTTEAEETTETTTEPESTTEIPMPYLVAKKDTVTIDRENYVVYGFKEYLNKTEIPDYVKVNDESIGRLEITYVNDASWMPQSGTGTKIEVIDTRTNNVVETFYMVIFGDLNGDSLAQAIDSTYADDEAQGITSWSDKTSSDYAVYMVIAADLDHDGIITKADALTIGDASIGLGRIDQVTGTHKVN